MEVLCGLARWSHGWRNWRPGGVIRGKWRILDGKEGEWSDLKFGAPRWWPLLCQLRPAPVRSEWTNIWNVLTHTGHMESSNWVALCAAEMEAILPYLMGIQWDTAWATHGVSTEAYAWKTSTRVRWALIVSLTTLWTAATHDALWACVCHVVRFIPLQGLLLIRISVTPSDMGDGLFAVSKCRFINFVILWW
jgi:hypothetical protein